MKLMVLIVTGLFAVMLVNGNAAEATDAKALFTKYCQGCHGPDGKGQTTLGKRLKVRDYTDAKVQSELKDEQIFKAIKEGLKKEDKVLMKPYAEKLSDEEIKSLVAYIRKFKQP